MFVRLALEEDRAAYIELARQAVVESVRDVEFNAGKVSKTFDSYLAKAHPTIFVVEHQGEIIGFLNATISEYSFADCIYTTQEVLFVRSDYRGTRAAAKLLKMFVEWSDRLGALENTGGNDNGLFTERTTRLLGRFGFEHVGHFMRRVGGSNGEKGRR